MSHVIGVRREDKHDYEARVPLTPEGVAELTRAGLSLVVQPSTIRAYDDAKYRDAGAQVDEELDGCGVVFAVKEIPERLFRRGGAYVFFSHTIKGQSHNMPMLRKLMELGCTLIDYEKITDDAGRRLVFFGRHAGLAGMIDTLSVTGRRLRARGVETALAELRLAHEYDDLTEARQAVSAIGKQLAERPFPEALAPFVIGFAGYGNVSRGAQEIVDLLPTESIDPTELAALVARPDAPRDRVFTVVYEERHLVEPIGDEAFELQTYYDHPERFRSTFSSAAPSLSVLVNAIYWTDAYPRLMPLEDLKRWYHHEATRLVAVGDISCDIDGAIQCTVKATTPNTPAYVYDPETGTATDGVDGPGLCMMTTDCLPCELPRESSSAFTEALLPFVAAIAEADFAGSLDEAGLPDPIRRACILYRGELTEPFQYMAQFVS
jgi:alanine dehydrogenase